MVYYYPLYSESASHKHPCDACDACDACDVFSVERHCGVKNKSYLCSLKIWVVEDSRYP